MDSGSSDRPRKRSRRYAAAAIGVVGALGVFSAIGTNVVNEVFPGIWRLITGTDSLRINVRDAPGANDGFALAIWSSQGLASQLGHVDGCESLLATADDLGAVRVGRSYKDLVVEGSTDRDVTIVDLRAEVVDRRPPMHGAEIHCQSAGGIGGIGISFDFDEPKPVARRVSEDTNNGKPYFLNGDAIMLKQGEVQPIQITAMTTHGYVVWNIVADLVVDGESETITIDDNGEPFQLTPGPPDVKFTHYYEWLWFEHPQRLYASNHPFYP